MHNELIFSVKCPNFSFLKTMVEWAKHLICIGADSGPNFSKTTILGLEVFYQH